MRLKEIDPFVRQILIGYVGESNSKDVNMTLKTVDCRLFYITDGTGEMIIRDKAYPLHKGCAILFQSGTRYIWNTKGASYIVVNFDYTNSFSHITSHFHPFKEGFFEHGHIFENIVFSDAVALNHPIWLRDAYNIESLLRTMASAFYIHDEFVREMLSAYMKAVIITVLTDYQKTSLSRSQTRDEAVHNILGYIQSHYAESITNEDIARLSHFHEAYANRIFKKSTGQTIHSFLTQYRISIARELLCTQNDPIHTIAYDTGFFDVPHFVKTFKRITGYTPSEYRAVHRTNLQDIDETNEKI